MKVIDVVTGGKGKEEPTSERSKEAHYEVPSQLKQRLRLSPHQIHDLKEAFSLFDTESKGHIAVKDSETLLRTLGLRRSSSISEETDDQLHGSLDPSHGTGQIDFLQFLQLSSQSASRRMSYQVESEMRDAFDLFDTNNKGYLTAKDLKRVMFNLGDCTVTDADIVDMMREADLNKDSHISFDEFRRIMSRPMNDLN